MNILKDEYLSVIVDKLKENAKISVKDRDTTLIKALFYTIGALSINTDTYNTRVKADDGGSFDLADYQLDSRFAPFVQPRAITYALGDNSPNVVEPRASILEMLEKGGAFTAIAEKFELDEQSCWYNEKFGERILTPGQFMLAQSQLLSWYRLTIDTTLSMKELTAPKLVADVVDHLDDGVKAVIPGGQKDKLPVSIKGAELVYNEYMFNYPLKTYLEEFVSYFIVSKLK